ncbi:MAG: (Fe-S)-binding protein [Ilumatobacteraceae bacterium]
MATASAARRGRHCPAGAGRCVLRCAARARQSRRRDPPPGRRPSSPRCPATHRSWSTRPRCGATLKDYGHLLGTPEAEAFAARVLDVHEFVADRIDRLDHLLPTRRPGTVIVQDPCHLRHVQRVHPAVRTVLSRVAGRCGRTRRRRAVLRHRWRLFGARARARRTDP